MVEMVRQRLLGILADDEDCSDHDDLMRVVDRLRDQRPDIAVQLAGHWPRWPCYHALGQRALAG